VKQHDAIRYIVVEMTPVQSLDSTALHMIEDLVKDCRVRGMHVVFASCGSGAEETMRRAGIQRHVGYEWFHPNVNSAVEFCVRHRAATDALAERVRADSADLPDDDLPDAAAAKDAKDEVSVVVSDGNDGDVELGNGLRSRKSVAQRMMPSLFSSSTARRDAVKTAPTTTADAKKTDGDDPKKAKEQKVLLLASKHRVVERSLDVNPLDNELLAPERRALDAYTQQKDEEKKRKSGSKSPPPQQTIITTPRPADATTNLMATRDKYAFLASRRAVIQRSATSAAAPVTAPDHEALAPAQVVAVVDPEVPDLMLNVVVDTLDRPGLVRDIGAIITQDLAYQIRFSEAAVVSRRSISNWRCEVPRRGLTDVAQAATHAEAVLLRALQRTKA